ncbi:MAG: sigma-70 family RNA polymerase sigma factor [Rhodoferax sp.]|uniref:RNA polymerase sigma factor n=1 Tax=Rhodoferax sp. TaxID=50421 RepID=UPI0032652FFF
MRCATSPQGMPTEPAAASPVRPVNDVPDELAALLYRTAAGCHDAFGLLYRRSRGRLFGVILRINQDQGEAEEVLQETYIKVWHQCRWFEASRGHSSGWLASIARNSAIDSLKRRACRPQRALLCTDHGDDVYAWSYSPDDGPLESLVLRRRAAAVQRCLRALPVGERNSVMLAYFGGMRFEDIAVQLGCPLGTVKTRVRRGLLRLRSALDAEQ